MLTRRELRYFRAHSDMVYKDRVTGHFRGTTDEIIQWAAYKHGISEDLLRAVAVQESWWHMSTNGDNGDSFGLFQLRTPVSLLPEVRARVDRVQRRLLRSDPARLLRRQGGVAEHCRARPRVQGRRPVGERRRLVCRPLAHAAGRAVHRAGQGASEGAHLAHAGLLVSDSQFRWRSAGSRHDHASRSLRANFRIGTL